MSIRPSAIVFVLGIAFHEVIVDAAVTGISVSPPSPTVNQAANVTVTGQNPCGAIEINFGDGTVVIKAAPGHTPGHQVLVLRLASTGRIMLGGDLYHYPPERTLRRAPPDNEFNVPQSAASRVSIEEYLARTKTTIWIEHDFATIEKLKKSPAFYD